MYAERVKLFVLKQRFNFLRLRYHATETQLKNFPIKSVFVIPCNTSQVYTHDTFSILINTIYIKHTLTPFRDTLFKCFNKIIKIILFFIL